MIVETRQTSVVQWLANSGFDFVLIDAEHGPFSIETIADLSRTARLLGITPIVRVPDLTYAAITQPLDAGAQGIMAPRITAPEQVEEIVRAMKYPPAGRRGSVMARGHTNFHTGPIDEAMQTLNEESLLVAQIETREAIGQIDSILGVPGVDVGLVGPTDLSVALGKPGRFEDPVLVSAIEKAIEACVRHSVVPAIHVNELERAAFWARKGMQMVSISSEAGLMMKAGREITSALAGLYRR
jgi:2-keto-3-deoxy-L-rhamnonate aldolase RhmA